ncbi:hypothetical protein F5Y04DRAFT_282352 [Hypomontagnella monticulosa]|nr:hypothetical protein F5Y04DRAFT_282352 [Hypomontagnella monticulosa]
MPELLLLAAASGLIKKIMQCLGLGSAVQSDLGKHVTDPTKITARLELGVLRRTVPEPYDGLGESEKSSRNFSPVLDPVMRCHPRRLTVRLFSLSLKDEVLGFILYKRNKGG